jgi:hypothetical protein
MGSWKGALQLHKHLYDGELHGAAMMVGIGDVPMIGLDEVKGFAAFKDDGIFEAKPMMPHLTMLKGFSLFYNWMRNLSSLLEHDAMMAIPIHSAHVVLWIP